MNSGKLRSFAVGLVILAIAITVVAYATRSSWLPPTSPAHAAPESKNAEKRLDRVILTMRAQENLGLSALPIELKGYEKTIQVPGMIVDQPGRSDRNVVTLVEGVVGAIYRFPGESVRPGDLLFTIAVSSTALNQTQLELLKATQDIKFAQAEIARQMGVVAEAKLIELRNQIIRSEAAVKAAQHELRIRGVESRSFESIVKGDFVEEIHIVAPARNRSERSPETDPPTFEIQELKVELGQPVQAGQTLCLLATHQMLAIEGQVFRDETPQLEQAVKHGWPLEVEFGDQRESQRDAHSYVAGTIGISNPLGFGPWNMASLVQHAEFSGTFPPAQHFVIQRLANSMNPVTRTFAFFVPLHNQSRVVERDGKTQLLWRYRPGQRVRLHIPISRLNNVFVLPAEAVARDGAEAFIFVQNANTYIRTSVRVLLHDRGKAIVADDGDLIEGTYVAQNCAAQLNRMVKSQSNSVPEGYHVHADGSLHKNSDEDH